MACVCLCIKTLDLISAGFAGTALRQPGQLLADFPEPLLRRLVIRLLRGLDRLTVDDILARHRRYLWRRRQIDGGLGPLLWAVREEPHRLRRGEIEETILAAVDARGDNAGMEPVRGDAAARQPTGKRVGEHDVGELRLAIDHQRAVSVPRMLQIVEG